MLSALENFKSIHLANLPTPLEEAPRLASKYGLEKLYLKRDDLTGLAGGGNKARKLEYDFAEILAGGYDVVITAGGAQSNHARMTAAAAFFGTEVRYQIDDDANDSLTRAMEQWAGELRRAGRRPFILPIGGSSGLGALGYVKAMHELASQLPDPKVQIVVGVGSCGTLAGIIVGAREFLPGARIIGISVSRTRDAIVQRTNELIRECRTLMNLSGDTASTTIECYDHYHGSYGEMTASGKQAILDCARLEGCILDPIYTGKVMAGLVDLAATGVLDRKLPVVFIHTGGLPINFAFGSDFGDCARIIRKHPKMPSSP
jgi:1-aminocyclopropane-1-carboxylate deaminase/D-cysteine desulfhydrase-like pyridoxal-dependent ACC family enzyme